MRNIGKMNEVTIKDANKKWRNSTIVRIIGMSISFILGFLTSILDGDTWKGAIILFIGLVLVFILVISIPDKILFGKDLKKRKGR